MKTEAKKTGNETTTASRVGDHWLLDELANLRRQLADVRSSYVRQHVGYADTTLLEALDTIRTIELEFYQ